MVSRFVAVSLLLALVGGSQADGVPEDLSFIKSIVEPLIDCNFGELSCSTDCLSIRICLGNGVYGEVAKCGATSMCEPKNATCVAGLAVCHVPNPETFICVDPKGGLFPNPFDCHSYFECKEKAKTNIAELPRALEFTKFPCVPGTNGYDPLTGMCIFPSSHRVCKEGPIPTCTVSMQSGALKENTNMFYVCVSIEGVLQPVLSRCPLDTDIFQNGKCVSTLR